VIRPPAPAAVAIAMHWWHNLLLYWKRWNETL
jgi:hypothetical protein